MAACVLARHSRDPENSLPVRGNRAGGNRRLLPAVSLVEESGPIWLLVPAAASLAVFAWLLTLHPTASGRVYAAYGGFYVVTALVWLRFVDGVKLSVTDWLGTAITVVGMLVIVSGWGART